MKKHAQVFMLDGVGINLEKFKAFFPEEKLALRSKYKYDSEDFIILYIAEFIPRKDHEFFIKNIPELRKQIPNLKVIMPGRGVQLKEMKILAVNLEVDDIVWFLGYRKDINLLCAISDLYVTTSRQEGLPISVIEAMASGLPIVASNIRGQTDAVVPGRNGQLYQLGNDADFVEKILALYKNPGLRAEMRKNNIEDSEKYSVDIAVEKMAEIYGECVRKNSILL
ncbi:glycosyltransferase [uncultured Treponema sp.]|uniref:glycosyltransferase n=1 Tax=uncultured Treponema sp. TaxID=162155 RepID=UPI00280B3D4D|nr:glycosyltransferase [uncultured Treponema sp.]